MNEFAPSPQYDIPLLAVFSQLYKSEVRFVICDSLEFEFTYLVEDALYVTACKCCKEDILASNKELELSFARLCGTAFAKHH